MAPNSPKPATVTQPSRPIPAQGVKTMTTRAPEKSTHLTLEQALGRINADPCSIAEIEAVNADQILGIDTTTGSSLDSFRKQAREILEDRIKTSGNGSDTAPKNSSLDGSNGHSIKVTTKGNGSETAETVPAEEELDDVSQEAVARRVKALGDEAADAEIVRDEIVDQRQARREAIKEVRGAQANSRKRVQEAQWSLMGALLGDADAREADQLEAEMLADTVNPGAALLAGYNRTAPAHSRLLQPGKITPPEE